MPPVVRSGPRSSTRARRGGEARPRRGRASISVASSRITSAGSLHPAENRALRELYAASQHQADRWPRLAGWIASEDAVAVREGGESAAPALERGAATARELLAELSALTPRYELYGSPGARGVGHTLAAARRGVVDRFLEQNQALRLAQLDVRHVVNLLRYLSEVAGTRGDEKLGDFHRRWIERLEVTEADLAEVVAALGRDPDQAIRAIDPSAAGTVARRIGTSVGTMGEAIDRRLGPRRR